MKEDTERPIGTINTTNQTPLKNVVRTGYIGEYGGDATYCNEKEYGGEGFLFKCGVNCKHNK